MVKLDRMKWEKCRVGGRRGEIGARGGKDRWRIRRRRKGCVRRNNNTNAA